ncbi:hypothetical protein B7P43_G05933 [Cryptotermes secundus]|uniref:Uncharacterized protein n=1 Tax=Cryptotermes secundus TaxID=105785 RepID=A0A2J7QA77_9NEOP|nr:cell growth-regulating nucleolar protein [Cryptotermes secundus]PNF25483.1 hypothetical protein B7P43_G05933 [Cryptotermes secundus]
MVFFTCAHCGESLKKSKVEKHYQTVCSRNSVAVTCVDCCKDFSDQTYPAHTKCVSEEEKYSAKGFVPRPSANKGEHKQKKWQDIICSLQGNDSSLSHDEQTILNIIVDRENVPRKKLKFQNFLRNCMKNHYNAQAAESIFDKIEGLSKEKELQNKQENQNEAEISKEDERENTDTVDVKENDGNISQEEVEKKLSKKEKKERRKREKYEAELKEIEGNEIIEAAGNNEVEGGKKKNPILTENETQEGREKSRSKRKGDVAVAENGVSEDNEGSRSKKKHKKEAIMSENGISEETEMAEGKKSKKKNKKEAIMSENGISEETEMAEGKKSKKNKKEAIMSENGISEETEMAEGKKSKKNKKKINATENTDTKMCEGGKSKKKRKKCQEEVDVCGEEPTKKKMKKNDTKEIEEEEYIHTASGKIKFNFQETIIKVLESKDTKELPVKRLRKKVLAELEASGAGSATDVKMIAKFNKKIMKIPGVIVRKEVVKLC